MLLAFDVVCRLTFVFFVPGVTSGSGDAEIPFSARLPVDASTVPHRSVDQAGLSD